MHLIHIAAQQIMHELADLGLASRRTIHVDDVSAVTKALSGRLYV